MDLTCALDNAGRGDRDGVDKAVLRHGAHKLVFHGLLLLCGKIDALLGFLRGAQHAGAAGKRRFVRIEREVSRQQ